MPASRIVAHLLHLTHVDESDGSDPQVFYASAADPGELSPASTQYVPCLEIPRGDDTARESLGTGRTARKPSPPSDTRLRLHRYTHGVDRLATLSGRSFLGQAATLLAVGLDGDGTTLAVSAPYVLATGTIRSCIIDTTRWDLTLRPDTAAYQREIPDTHLLGYRRGLLFDGTDDVVVFTGFQTAPDELTLLAYVFIPLEWDNSTAQPWCIMATRSLALYLNYNAATDPPTYYLTLLYTHNATPNYTTLTSDVDITPDERFHWLGVVVDKSGSGVTATFIYDATLSTRDTDANNYHSLAEDWQMGRYRSDNTTVASTVISAVLLFSSQLSAEDIETHTQQRIDTDETDLIFMIDGEVGSVSGDLLELADANSSTPYDGTITGAVNVPTMQGPPTMAGVRPPVVLHAQNIPLLPVDYAAGVYRAAHDHMDLIYGAYDRGAEIDIQHLADVKTWWTTSPSAGTVAITPWMGGCCKFASVVDDFDPTVDARGASRWPWSLALGSQYNGAYAVIPAGVHTLVNAEDGFAFELWWVWDPGTVTSLAYVFASSYLSVLHIGLGGNSPHGTFQVRVSKSGGGVFAPDTFRVQPFSTNAIRVEAWDDDGDLHVRVYLNGVLLSNDTDAGESLWRTTAAAAGLSGDNAGIRANHLGVLPLRIWAWDSTLAATADPREWLFANPDPAETGLLAMYTQPDGQDYTTVRDDTSNGNDASIVNPGTGLGRWRSGVAWTFPAAAVTLVAAEWAGKTPQLQASTWQARQDEQSTIFEDGGQ